MHNSTAEDEMLHSHDADGQKKQMDENREGLVFEVHDLLGRVQIRSREIEEPRDEIEVATPVSGGGGRNSSKHDGRRLQ